MKKEYIAGVDHIGICCVFICHDGSGNILLQKRSQHCRDEQGTWDCGGGALEFGESVEDCIRRELQEEYRVQPIDIQQIRTKSVIRMQQGAPTHWLAVTHLVRISRGEEAIGEPRKVDELRWCNLDTLPAPLHSMLLDDLQGAKAYL